MSKTHFEDHMKIVENGQEKTASASKVDGGLLQKLAAEIEKGAEAPSAEGQQAPAESSVTEANAAVVAQTDGVAVPQEVAAGADPAEKPAGEQPAATKANEGVVISASDGKATDANQLGKVPAAVATAATSAEGEKQAAAASPKVEEKIEKTAEQKEAEEIGRTMARSYVAELQKIAHEEQYAEAVGILKEANLLVDYNIEAKPMVKEASEKKEGERSGLEKIAETEALSKDDMIEAAVQYIEMAKQAEEADAAGREAAQEAAAEAPAEAAAAAAAPATEAAPAAPAVPEAEKTASDEISNAVRVLKEKGLIQD